MNCYYSQISPSLFHTYTQEMYSYIYNCSIKFTKYILLFGRRLRLRLLPHASLTSEITKMAATNITILVNFIFYPYS